MCGGMQRYTEVRGGAQRSVQRCAEVHGGVHGGAQRSAWRCTEVCGGAQRGAQRYAEACRGVRRGVWRVHGGARSWLPPATIPLVGDNREFEV